ncbi:hypothetical protein CCACVL1_18103 [Corchorus capsularis]|uniref:Uncharacterized protein n=1 Tax=Corchorus capsularis TaxID=210143 RepID=A0A1R3HMX4_COCAP|nr:hypothetical protein CCACVL1_18103 [Corchorus capsularis]
MAPMELMKRKVLLFLFVAMAIVLAAMVTPTASQCIPRSTVCNGLTSPPCCSPYSCKLIGVNRVCAL